MRNSVRGIQRLQHCGRLGVERIFKLWILVGVLEFNIVIWNGVIVVCFNEEFTCQVSLRLTAQLPNLGIKNASVRNLQPKRQRDTNILFHKTRGKEWRRKKTKERSQDKEEEQQQQQQQQQQQYERWNLENIFYLYFILFVLFVISATPFDFEICITTFTTV